MAGTPTQVTEITDEDVICQFLTERIAKVNCSIFYRPQIRRKLFERPIYASERDTKRLEELVTTVKFLARKHPLSDALRQKAVLLGLLESRDEAQALFNQYSLSGNFNSWKKSVEMVSFSSEAALSAAKANDTHRVLDIIMWCRYFFEDHVWFRNNGSWDYLENFTERERTSDNEDGHHAVVPIACEPSFWQEYPVLQVAVPVAFVAGATAFTYFLKDFL